MVEIVEADIEAGVAEVVTEAIEVVVVETVNMVIITDPPTQEVARVIRVMKLVILLTIFQKNMNATKCTNYRGIGHTREECNYSSDHNAQAGMMVSDNGNGI